MAKPRTKSQRERDRKIINELYLNGWTQQGIADKLGISQRTVGTDIKALRKEWLKENEYLRDEFVAKYSYIYQQAMAAWARSISKGQSGKPALLAQAQNALDAIRKMLSLDAPLENNVNLRIDDTVNKALERIYADNDAP
jgi:DNA-binding Lrp family transcriptional regulator